MKFFLLVSFPCYSENTADSNQCNETLSLQHRSAILVIRMSNRGSGRVIAAETGRDLGSSATLSAAGWLLCAVRWHDLRGEGHWAVEMVSNSSILPTEMKL